MGKNMKSLNPLITHDPVNGDELIVTRLEGSLSGNFHGKKCYDPSFFKWVTNHHLVVKKFHAETSQAVPLGEFSSIRFC
jgi:hypothetical protein